MMKESDDMEIVRDGDFASVIATQDYEEGQLVNILKGDILSEPTRQSIEIAENQHITDDFAKYMNHSFNPNCSIQGYHIVALKKIIEGDELTFDYNTTESKLACPFIDRETNRLVAGFKADES
jgi:hypothetical protein